MRLALAEARRALEADEVPIGAIVVSEGRVVGAGFNQPIRATDPTAHAEVLALREAAHSVGNYRLTGSALYVTIEPCLMCVGAAVNARVARIVYGAAEPKAGAVRSLLVADELPLNHRFEAIGGVLETDCRRLIQDFFKYRRGSR